MSNESLNKPPDANANQKENKANGKDFPGIKAKRKAVKAYLYELFGALLLWVGFSINHILISLPFTISGLVCCAGGIRVYLENFNVRHNRARNWGVLFFVVGALAWTAIKLPPAEQESKPHLEWTLNTADSPNAELALTNEFLFVADEFPNKDVNGYLIVPLPSETAVPVLKFTLSNTSSVVAEEVLVVCTITKDCEFSSDGWKEIRKTAKDTPVETRTIGVELGNLVAGVGKELPEIRFSKWPNPTNTPPSPPLVAIRIRSKNVPKRTLAFWIAFPRWRATKPRIAFSTIKDRPIQMWMPYDDFKKSNQ